MKISLYSRDRLAFNPYTEKNLGVGSTETILINLGEQLTKEGHDVIAYVNCNFPDIYDGVKYYKSYDYKPNYEDVVVGFGSLPKFVHCDQVFFWSTKVEIEKIKAIDHQIKNLIVSSEWHRDRYASELSSEILEITKVIEPGVTEDFLKFNQEKWPLSITYAGPPQKGALETIIEYTKRLKPKNKDIAIHVYSGAALWGADDDKYRPLYDSLIKNKVYFHGQKGKRRLIKQFGQSQIFIYPVRKSYQQAFGLTVLEAMAAGCVVIASGNGNLKNIVGDAGFIINEDINDYKWSLEALDYTLKLFDDPSLMSKMSEKAREYARKYTWDKTTRKFLELV